MVLLTNRQIDLLLKYSAPFIDLSKQLEEASKKDELHHKILIDEYFTNLILADLVHYSKNIDDDDLLEEINDLYHVLESGL